MQKIPYHLIGGLGDVCLTRKLPQLYSKDLREKVHISSIVDVYPQERVSDPASIENLFEEIKHRKIKGKLEDEVAAELVRGLSSGKIKYFQATAQDFYNSFFSFVNSLPNSAIDISTPNKTHLSLFSNSLSQTEANIIIEKPVVPYKSDLRVIDDLLTKHSKNRVLMDAEHYSYYGNIRHYIENFENFVRGIGTNGKELKPLGNVKEIILKLQENEGFDSIRNQNVIDKRVSGGGILLDLGPHCFSFLKCLGAKVNPAEIECTAKKANLPQISDDYHGETSVSANFTVCGNNFLEEAKVKLSIGKALERKKKNFYIGHENGMVDLSVDDRRLRIYSLEGEMLSEEFFRVDAFGNAINSFVDKIKDRNKSVETPISRAVSYLLDLFTVQDAMVLAS